MNSEEYWLKREQQKLDEQMKDVKKLEVKLNREFAKASKEIEKEINTLFQRYAKDNKLSYVEAEKYLTSKEFREWKYDLKEYISLIESTGDEKLLIELNTLAMKSRISRLEEIKYQINKHINNTYSEVYTGTTELLKASVKDSYYKTIYDVQKYVGVGASFAKVDEKLIKEILSYPWSGKNYSQRIWGTNRDRLKDILETEMTQMITRGESSRTVAKRVSEVMDVCYERAISLINTEHSYVMSEATAIAFKESGVEKYEFLATLDTRTSKTCQSLDGKVFKLSERQVGVNASPMHTRCRSTEIPYIEGDSLTTRFARDKNDKGIEVPSNMKYDEWYKKYVEA